MADGQSGSFDPDQCSSLRLQHVAAAAIGWRTRRGWPVTGRAGSSPGADRALRHADLAVVSVRASLCRRADRSQSQYPRLADRGADDRLDPTCASDHRAKPMSKAPDLARRAPTLALPRERGREGEGTELVLELDGYEGPIDLLLA